MDNLSKIFKLKLSEFKKKDIIKFIKLYQKYDKIIIIEN